MATIYEDIDVAHMVDIWYRENGETYTLLPGQVTPFVDYTGPVFDAGYTVYSGAHGQNDTGTEPLVRRKYWYTNIQNRVLTLNEATGPFSEDVIGFGCGAAVHPIGRQPAGLSLASPVEGWEPTVTYNRVTVSKFAQAHVRARCAAGILTNRDTGQKKVFLEWKRAMPTIWGCAERMPDPKIFGQVVNRYDTLEQRERPFVKLPIPVVLTPIDLLLKRKGYSREDVRNILLRWRIMVDTLMRENNLTRLYLGSGDDPLVNEPMYDKVKSSDYCQYTVDITANPDIKSIHLLPPTYRMWTNTSLHMGDICAPIDGGAREAALTALSNRSFVSSFAGDTL